MFILPKWGNPFKLSFIYLNIFKFSVLYKMEEVFFPKLIKRDCVARRSFLKETF